MKRDARGDPMPNPIPPHCEQTPCRSREARPRVGATGWLAYSTWRHCHVFRCLPGPGGLDDQNEALLELIHICEAFHERAERESGLGLLGALFGLKAMTR